MNLLSDVYLIWKRNFIKNTLNSNFKKVSNLNDFLMRKAHKYPNWYLVLDKDGMNKKHWFNFSETN